MGKRGRSNPRPQRIEAVPPRHNLPIAALILVIALLLFFKIETTGLAIANTEVQYLKTINEKYDREITNRILVFENDPTSLKITGDVKHGDARVVLKYLDGTTKTMLDTSNLVADQTGTKTFTDACTDTCSLIDTEKNIELVYYTFPDPDKNKATLSVDHLTYTALQPLEETPELIWTAEKTSFVVGEATPLEMQLKDYFGYNDPRIEREMTFLATAPPTLTIDLINDQLTVTPKPGFTGTESITIIASDDINQPLRMEITLEVQGDLTEEELLAANSPADVDEEVKDSLELGYTSVDVIVEFRETPREVLAQTNEELYLAEKRIETKDVLERFDQRYTTKEDMEEYDPAYVSETQHDLDVKHKGKSKAIVSGKVTEKGLNALLKDPKVASVKIDRTFGVALTETIPLIQADVVHAQNVGGTSLTGSGHAVCVLDTGTELLHDAYTERIIGGYDFVNDDLIPEDDNLQSHGTHMTGIVAAQRFNGSNVSGVAPGADVVIVKVCNSLGECKMSDIMAGIDYCINNKDIFNIDVITGSFGDNEEWNSSSCPTYFDELLATADAVDISTVFSTGNQEFNNGVNYPACNQYSVGVGATTNEDQLTAFTNVGQGTDVLAPGQNVFSTVVGNGFNFASGTSVSTPHVAGAALLLYQYSALQGIDVIPATVKQILAESGVDVAGYPRVDVAAAVEQLGTGNYTAPESEYMINESLNRVENPHGAIQFTQPTFMDGITNCISFSYNHIELDSELCAEYSIEAQVEIYNLPYTENVQVLRDNEGCPEEVCTNVQYTNGTLTFTVPGFTTYSATGSTGNATSNFTVQGTATSTSCGTVDSDLTLSSGIVATGTCFTILADDITINGAGNEVFCPGLCTMAGNYYGINNSGGYDNITIKNIRLTQFSEGVHAEGMANSTFEEVNIGNLAVDPNSNQGTALNCVNCVNNVFNNSIWKAGASGSKGVILGTGSTHNRFTENTIAGTDTGASAYGLQIQADHNYFRGGNIKSTNAAEIYVADGTYDNLTFTNISLTNDGLKFIEFTANNVEDVSIGVNTSLASAPGGKAIAGTLGLNVVDVGVVGASVNLTLNYSESGIDEDTLTMHKYDGSWASLGTSVTDTALNKVTSGVVTSFSTFAPIYNATCPMYVNADLLQTENVNGNDMCYIVNASNIVIDGGGYNLTGGGSTGAGIWNPGGFDNITIKNFQNISGFMRSVNFTSSTNNLIENSTLWNIGNTNSRSVYFESVNNSNITDSRLETVAENRFSRALEILNSESNFISGNTVYNPDGGIAISLENTQDHTFFQNTVNSSNSNAISGNTDMDGLNLTNNVIESPSSAALGITEVNNSFIKNNRIIAGSQGISISMDNTLIENNNITTNLFTFSYGIYSQGSSNDNIIRENNITTSTTDAKAIYEQGGRNVIEDNRIFTRGLRGHGIHVQASVAGSNTNHRIENNTIYASGSSSYAIYLNQGHLNNITNNNLRKASQFGYGILISDSDGNRIVNNDVYMESGTGGALYLQSSPAENIIDHNNFTTLANFYQGAYIHGTRHRITNNNFTTNAQSATGVYLEFASNTLFENNTIQTLDSSATNAYGYQVGSGSNNNNFTRENISTASSPQLFFQGFGGNSGNRITGLTIQNKVNFTSFNIADVSIKYNATPASHTLYNLSDYLDIHDSSFGIGSPSLQFNVTYTADEEAAIEESTARMYTYNHSAGDPWQEWGSTLDTTNNILVSPTISGASDLSRFVASFANASAAPTPLSCGTTLSSNTNITSNLTVSSGNCFVVTSGVTITCQNNSAIINTGTARRAFSMLNQNNIRIEHCQTYHFAAGYDIVWGSDITLVNDSSINNSYAGFNFTSVTHSEIINSTVLNINATGAAPFVTGRGIYLNNSQNVTVLNANITVLSKGIMIFDGSLNNISSSIINSSATLASGIELDSATTENIIEYNTIESEGSHGVSLLNTGTNSNRITGNTIRAESANNKAVHIFSGVGDGPARNVFTNNDVTALGTGDSYGYNIQYSADNEIRRGTINSTDSAAIYVIGSAATGAGGTIIDHVRLEGAINFSAEKVGNVSIAYNSSSAAADAGLVSLGDSLHIESTAGESILNFSVTYDESEVSNIVESSVKIYRYDESDSAWNALGSSTVDTANNNISSGVITSFSDFNSFGSSPPNLTVTKTDSPDPVNAGSQLTYNITLDNTGGGAIINVNVSDTLPAGVTYHSSQPDTDSGTVVNWTVDVPANTISIINVTVNVSSGLGGSLINNSVNTTYDNGSNIVTLNQTINTTVSTPPPSITITKSSDQDPVPSGNYLLYTLTITNTGGAATNTNVTDILPTGVTYITANLTPDSVTLNGKQLNWTLDVGAGATRLIEVNVSVHFVETDTSFTNIANITYDTGTSLSTENTSLDVVASGCQLLLVKEDRTDTEDVICRIIQVTSDAHWSINDSITITATENMTIEAGSVINGSERGFNSSDGPGKGGDGSSSRGGNGAGHGGYGGEGFLTNTDRGVVYGSALQPVTNGSGGGNGINALFPGGRGGVAVKIVVGDTLSHSGIIETKGGVGTDYTAGAAGGGSGGSIYVNTTNLVGTGLFLAQGGLGGEDNSGTDSDGGAGAGGHIAIYADDASDYHGEVSSSVAGGVARDSAEGGQPGTFAIIDRDENDLLITHGFRFLESDEINDGFFFRNIVMTNASVFVNTTTRLNASNTVNMTNTHMEKATARVSDPRTGPMYNLTTVTTNFTLINSNISKVQAIKINASTVTIDSTSSVDSNYSGHNATEGPGTGGSGTSSRGAGGAGHGGYGGDGFNEPGYGIMGSAYGSALQPNTLGSGGGNGQNYLVPGGRGGGLISIQEVDVFSHDGIIQANGQKGDDQTNAAGGGGAGGTIFINTSTLIGSGTFHADGGDGGADNSGTDADGGAGAGGHIAVYYSTGDSFSGIRGSTVEKGRAEPVSPNAENGQQGTLIFIDRDTRDATIHNGFRFLESDATGDGFFFQTVNISDAEVRLNTTTRLNGTTITITNSNIYAEDLREPDVIDRPDKHNLTIVGTNISFQNSSTIWIQKVVINTTDLSIDASSRINSSYAGFNTSEGPGAGPDGTTARGGSGGGHAGYGGTGYRNTGGAGALYGSALYPDTLGSGGGLGQTYVFPGGTGGGLVKITVANVFAHNGAIEVNGLNGSRSSNAGAGGGAGGSIFVNASTLEGSGTFHANGGDGGDDGVSTDSDGGGGSGGHIAVYSGTKTDYTGISGSTVTAGSGNNSADHGSVGNLIFIDTDTQDAEIYQGFRFTLLDETNDQFTFNSLNVSDAEVFVNTTTTLAITEWLRMENSVLKNGDQNQSKEIEEPRENNITIEATNITLINTNVSKIGYVNIVTTNITTDSNSIINLSMSGFIHSEGPGAGEDGSTAQGTGGAGHGGAGGTGEGTAAGDAYDDAYVPTQKGSGGGDLPASDGGRGGGILHITAAGFINLNGLVSVDGENGTFTANGGNGGGSGGSVLLNSSNIIVNTIRARGGYGTNDSVGADNGGGGAGGRISTCTRSTTTAQELTINGNVVVTGGIAWDTAGNGSNGTFARLRAYDAPTDAATAALTATSDYRGSLSDNDVACETQDITYRNSTHTLVSISAHFLNGTVNASTLTIDSSDDGPAYTVLNTSTVENMGQHVFYVKNISNNGLIVCPNAQSVGDLSLDCDSKVNFTTAEAVAGTTRSGVTVNFNTSTNQYVISGLSGSGAQENETIVLPGDGSVANLSISKTSSPNPVSAGAQLTYTINITNSGTANATNVNISDTIMSGTTYHSAQPTPTAQSGQQVNWTQELAANTTYLFNITVNVSGASIAEETLTNNVNATYDNGSITTINASTDTTIQTPQCGTNLTGTITLSADVTATGTCYNVTGPATITCTPGVTIQGDGTGYAFYIDGQDNVDIRHCTTKWFESGWRMNAATNIILINDTSINNSNSGFRYDSVTSSTLANSTSHNMSSTAVSVRVTSSSGLRIDNNNITTTNGQGHGILMQNGGTSNITQNQISTSGQSATGIRLITATNNILDGNTVTTTNSFAPGIVLQSSSHNGQVRNNVISTAGTTAEGLSIINTNSINVTNNTITGVLRCGLFISTSDGNNFTQNTISVSNPTFGAMCFSGDVTNNQFNDDKVNSSSKAELYFGSTATNNKITGMLLMGSVNFTSHHQTYVSVDVNENTITDPTGKASLPQHNLTILSLGAGAFVDYNLTYTDAQVAAAGMTESSIKIHRYNSSTTTWDSLATSSVDTTNNVVSSGNISTDFGNFTPFGDTPATLTIDKTDSADPVNVSTQYNYTLNITNTGGLATNVNISDTLPLNITYHAANLTPASINGQEINWTLNMSAGQTRYIVITVNATEGIPNGTVVNNTVNMTYNNGTADISTLASETTTITTTPVACGTTITGTVSITQDLSTPGTCFNVTGPATITCTEGVRITGDGTGAAFEMANTDDVLIEYCTVYSFKNGFNATAGENITFRHDNAHNNTLAGFQFTTINEGTLLNNTAQNNSFTVGTPLQGAVVLDTTTNTTVTEQTIKHNNVSGIYGTNTVNTTVENSLLENNTFACTNDNCANIYLATGTTTTVQSNTVQNTAEDGIFMSGSGVTNNIMFNNTILNMSDDSIVISGGSEWNVTANIIFDDTDRGAFSDGLTTTSISDSYFAQNLIEKRNGDRLAVGSGTQDNVTYYDNTFSLRGVNGGVSRWDGTFTNMNFTANSIEPGFSGFRFYGTISDSYFMRNNFTKVRGGLWFTGASSNNLIQSNNFSSLGTSASGGAAIYLTGTHSENIVENNIISSMPVSGSTAILLAGVAVENNTIRYNDVNQTNARKSDWGIRLIIDAHNNTVYQNILSGAAEVGMIIYDGADDNNITENTIVNNPAGLLLGLTDDSDSVRSNTINNNTYTNNTGYNLKVQDSFMNTFVNTLVPALTTIDAANYGRVNFTQTVDITGAFILGDVMSITHNKTFVNSSAQPGLNLTADIILRNLTFNNPEPHVNASNTDAEDFVFCTTDRCTELSYDGTSFTFNVTQFSTYVAKESLDCGQNVTGTTTISTSLNTTGGSCLNVTGPATITCGPGVIISGDGSGYAFYIDGQSDIDIRHCTTINHLAGWRMINSDNITLVNDTSIQNSEAGFRYDSVTDSLLADSTTYNTTGSAVGVQTEGTTQNVLIENNTINTTNTAGLGISLEGTSTSIDINNNSIDTWAASAIGIHVQDSSTGNTVRNNTITTNSTSASGVQVDTNNNNVTFNNITTGGTGQSNSNSHGVWMNRVTGGIIANNTILIQDSNAQGVYLRRGGDHEVSGNTITTEGTTAYCIWNWGSSGNTLADNIGSTTGTTGTESEGSRCIVLQGDSNNGPQNNTIIRNIITTTGTFAYGIHLEQLFAKIPAFNTLSSNMVTTTGGNAHAIMVEGASHNSLENNTFVAGNGFPVRLELTSLGAINNSFVNDKANQTATGGEIYVESGSLDNKITGMLLMGQVNFTSHYMNAVSIDVNENTITDPATKVSLPLHNLTITGYALGANIDYNLTYTDAQVTAAGITESSLRIHRYNSSTTTWDSLATSSVDTTNNIVSSGNISSIQFTTYNYTPFGEVSPVLTLSKTVDTTEITAGDQLEFVISINNSGGQATGVSITDTLPTGLVYHTATPSPSAQSGQQINWTNQTIAGGTLVTYNITANVSTDVANGTLVANTVNVTYNNGTDLVNLTNTTTNITIFRLNISIIKSDSPDPGSPGQLLNYTLTITNNGESNKTVTVTESYPGRFNFLSATPNATTGNNVWILNVSAGQTKTINITGRIVTGVGSTLENFVTAQTNGTNNITVNATEITTVTIPGVGGGGGGGSGGEKASSSETTTTGPSTTTVATAVRSEIAEEEPPEEIIVEEDPSEVQRRPIRLAPGPTCAVSKGLVYISIALGLLLILSVTLGSFLNMKKSNWLNTESGYLLMAANGGLLIFIYFACGELLFYALLANVFITMTNFLFSASSEEKPGSRLVSASKFVWRKKEPTQKLKKSRKK